ncbi:MAG: serine hydrolase [Candidatus Riflemargulisbacteria bacterium]
MKKLLLFLLVSFSFSITPDISEVIKIPIINTSNVQISSSRQVEHTINEFVSVDEVVFINAEQVVTLNEVIREPETPKENIMSHFDEDSNVRILPLAKVNTNIKTDIAIMIDCNSGDVLFEKNADKYWSAASLTKVFLLYLIMDKVEKGEIDLDEYIDIEDEAWLGNMPADATTMHLEQGQRVTYRQLIQGLSIVSANDAAYLFVNKLFGGKDNYAKTINLFLANHGYNQLHVEEPSGISNFNRITARQFASFCNLYIDKNSKWLETLHSVPSFTYPLKENLVEGRKYKYKAVTRNNTNTLLGKYEGVDGLKTGYLSVSGFNIVATAKRNGKRLLVVLLGGANGKPNLIEDAKKVV